MKFGYTIIYVPDVSASLTFFENAFGVRRRFFMNLAPMAHWLNCARRSRPKTHEKIDYAGTEALGKAANRRGRTPAQ